MTGAGGRKILLMLCGLAAVTAAGCAELDFLPSWVPFQGPASDVLPGVVPPAQRISELQKLSETAAGKTAEEKVKISGELAVSIRTERDPVIRVEIIRALGHYPGAAADAILKAALSDPETNVRVVACEAWGHHGSPEAVALLSEALRSDVQSDVRLAAAKALGETRNAAAVPALGEALSDADPAMQYRAMLSLEQVTGKDLGDHLDRWQQYVKGEQPPADPTLGERARHIF